MGVHTHRNIRTHILSMLISWFCCFHQDHFLSDRHYNNVAEIMSSVCYWARLDLYQKPQGPVSLIKCMEDGCNRLLHHMCQCMWESDDEDVAKNMVPESFAHITIQLWPRAVSCRHWCSFQSSPGIQPIKNGDNVHNDY